MKTTITYLAIFDTETMQRCFLNVYGVYVFNMCALGFFNGVFSKIYAPFRNKSFCSSNLVFGLFPISILFNPSFVASDRMYFGSILNVGLLSLASKIETLIVTILFCFFIFFFQRAVTNPYPQLFVLISSVILYIKFLFREVHGLESLFSWKYHGYLARPLEALLVSSPALENSDEAVVTKPIRRKKCGPRVRHSNGLLARSCHSRNTAAKDSKKNPSPVKP